MAIQFLAIGHILMAEFELNQAPIPILAVVLAFLLSQFAEFIRYQRDKNLLNSSIRKIVDREISRNHSLLLEFWQAVVNSCKDGSSEGQGKLNYGQMASAVINNPFPPVKSSVWYASISRLASVYSKEELNEKCRHHEAVDCCINIYNRIQLLDRDAEAIRLRPKPPRATETTAQSLFSSMDSSAIESIRQSKIKRVIDLVPQLEAQVRLVLGDDYIEA
ncbi:MULTISPECIES: hypothetical protein [unclassified Synechococcus]|uniref:hypothetical protein n=1 Tax=unclassified Synechococcus TaxID=2626047 RepID=UPI0020CEAAE0|nr:MULTISPECIES: hypothetical protein [unclassified Synechococcus]